MNKRYRPVLWSWNKSICNGIVFVLMSQPNYKRLPTRPYNCTTAIELHRPNNDIATALLFWVDNKLWAKLVKCS